MGGGAAALEPGAAIVATTQPLTNPMRSGVAEMRAIVARMSGRDQGRGSGRLQRGGGSRHPSWRQRRRQGWRFGRHRDLDLTEYLRAGGHPQQTNPDRPNPVDAPHTDGTSAHAEKEVSDPQHRARAECKTLPTTTGAFRQVRELNQVRAMVIGGGRTNCPAVVDRTRTNRPAMLHGTSTVESVWCWDRVAAVCQSASAPPQGWAEPDCEGRIHTWRLSP